MPSFGQHFENALVHGRHVTGNGPAGIGVAQFAGRRQLVDGGHGQPGDHSAGAITQQAAEMVNFPGLSGFDDQAALCPPADPNEVVMHGGGGQQGRNGCMPGRDAAVRKDQQPGTGLHGLGGPAAKAVQGRV